MPATAYTHDVDPKAALLERCGDLEGVEIFHNQVICAIYIAPEKTKGGIIRPQSNVDEDRHQGKVGLIIKMGPQAFGPDNRWRWPDDMGLHQWVFYRASDGWPCSVNQAPCRVLDDVDIKGRAWHPDQVW